MRVLVVFDEPAMCLTYGTILEMSGYAVRSVHAPLRNDKGRTSYSAETADQLLETASNFRPDRMIMMLQGLDSSGQMDVAIAIHNLMPAAKFVFFINHPPEKELEIAGTHGLDHQFGVVPLPISDLLDMLGNSGT